MRLIELTALTVYDWVIIAVMIMLLACCMVGNSSSNPNWWSV